MFDTEIATLSTLVSEALHHLQIPLEDEVRWTPIPFQGRWGVGTAASFQAAALEAKEDAQIRVPVRAEEIARQVAGRLEPPAGFREITAERGYINAYFDTSSYASSVINSAIDLGPSFGRGEARGERVMVEYAQPNTHHSFHIGHARNTVLGESLARLVEFAGFQTVRASYPGDIGLGVITCLWGYQRFHTGEEPEGVHERGQWLAKLYHESNDRLREKAEETEDERALRHEYETERRELYRRWDEDDPEIKELWHRTRQWSLDELEAILDMLNVKMDVYFFESEVDRPAKEIVEELVALSIAEDERPEGPVLVKIDEKLGLDREKYRTAILLRSDGTTLYLAKDLALAKQKFEQYQIDRSIYVVDVRQSLHFQQAFKILELWGFPQASKCHHLAYGFVTLPEGAMSSRLGNVILFKAVADEAERRVKAVIAEKNPSLPEREREEVARMIGLGALTYAMLSVDSVKDIVFEWDEALSFDGKSAPYIQNAHVRANSILKKAGEMPRAASLDHDLAPLEAELLDWISRFPATAEKAALEYKPLHMASYAYELAKTFHAFYHEVPVIQSEDPAVRDARLRLVAAARQTLANSLWLLDIEAPSVM